MKKNYTANELNIGDKAKVLELDVSNKEIKHHLLDMVASLKGNE